MSSAIHVYARVFYGFHMRQAPCTHSLAGVTVHTEENITRVCARVLLTVSDKHWLESHMKSIESRFILLRLRLFLLFRFVFRCEKYFTLSGVSALLPFVQPHVHGCRRSWPTENSQSRALTFFVYFQLEIG